MHAQRPPDSFEGIEASTLFCPKCNKAQPVRRKLLLVLPSGEKHAYYCQVCGEEVGSKMEEDKSGPLWRLS